MVSTVFMCCINICEADIMEIFWSVVLGDRCVCKVDNLHFIDTIAKTTENDYQTLDQHDKQIFFKIFAKIELLQTKRLHRTVECWNDTHVLPQCGMVHRNFLSFVCVLTWFSKLFFWTNFCEQCSQLYWRSLCIFSCINKLLRFINLKHETNIHFRSNYDNRRPMLLSPYILPQSTHFHFRSLFFIFSAVRCSRRCCFNSS